MPAKKASKKSRKTPAKKPVKKTPKKPAKAAAKKVAATPVKKAPRQPSAAFMKPMAPSLALTAIVGSAPLPRTEITRRLWAYIREQQLQDPQNRRMIKADDRLKAVFNGQEAVSMFELTKLVNQNLSEPPQTLAALPPAEVPPPPPVQSPPPPAVPAPTV